MGKKTSPWVYVGCGCAVFAVVAVLAVAGLGFKAWRDLEAFGETMSDPVARDARVREILGAEHLPGDLRGQLYLRIPFVLELAVATDSELDFDFERDGDDGKDSDRGGRRGRSRDGNAFSVDRHLLSLLDLRNFGDSRETFRNAMEAGEDPFSAFENADIDISVEVDEVLRHGRTTVGDTEYIFEIVRGYLSDTRPRRDGVAALADVRCADDDGRLRLLTWFRADAPRQALDAATSSAEAPASAETAATETTMVEAAPSDGSGADGIGRPDVDDDLRRLLGALDPCRGSDQSSP